MAPFASCWIFPIFNAENPNMGHFAYRSYLLYLKRNVWKTNNVETENASRFSL